MKIYQKFFGGKLKAAIKQAGMSQADFADKMKVSLPSVGRWLMGMNFPEDHRLTEICSLLDVDENYFLPGYDMEIKADLVTEIIGSLFALNQDELRSILPIIAASESRTASKRRAR